MGIIIDLPPSRRGVELRAASFDPGDNTIEVIWTTGAVVRRYDYRTSSYYDEELVVTEKAVRLGRLNGGAPFLNTHDDWTLGSVLGAVVPGSAQITRGIGTARVQLSVADEHAGIIANIKAAVIRNISVGYRNHKIEKTEPGDDGVSLWRVVDWEPLEISAVPVPADAGSLIRKEPTGKDALRLAPCEFLGGIDDAEAARLRMNMRAYGQH